MLTLQFTPFPVLESPRFLLRRAVPADIPSIFAMRSDPAVMRFIPRPINKTLADAEEVFKVMDEKIEQNTDINWAISPKEQPDIFIGSIGLYRVNVENHRGEIGYALLTEHWGKGIVSELIPVVLEYGFMQMGCHSIEAVIDPEHHVSRRVLEKNGFVQEAHLRQNCFFEGKFLDSVILGLLKSEYLSSK